ncbi:hypothetical protein Nmel_000425 [Mimus melanotis]
MTSDNTGLILGIYFAQLPQIYVTVLPAGNEVLFIQKLLFSSCDHYPAGKWERSSSLLLPHLFPFLPSVHCPDDFSDEMAIGVRYLSLRMVQTYQGTSFVFSRWRKISAQDPLEDHETIRKPLICFWFKDHLTGLPLKNEQLSSKNNAFWINLSLGWNMHYCGKIEHSLFSAEDSSSKVSSTPTIFMAMGQKGFTIDSGRFHNISLGQKQEMAAKEALKKAAPHGHWVLFQASVKTTSLMGNTSSAGGMVPEHKICGALQQNSKQKIILFRLL